jgi:hypothetical protein
MGDTEEEMEAAFQIGLSALPSDAQEQALAQRAESDAEIEATVAELLEEREEDQMFGSSYPPPPPEDPRWETMQYLLQAHLAAPDWDPDVD